MKEKKNKGVKLYCFSPPIMIATFIIEMVLAIYAYIQSRKYKSDVGIVLVLVFLAIFQLSEYQICEGTNLLFWAKAGFFAITFLPVLGLYLISRLKKEAPLLKLGFFIATALVTFFILVPNSIEAVSCTGNYVIFDITDNLYGLFGYYYAFFLLIGIWQASMGIKDSNKKKLKEVFSWFVIGYLSFILPLTIVYIFIPITRVAVASIMCGFAVIFAFILTFKIAPIYHKNIKIK